MDSSSVVNKLFTEIQRHENQIDAWCRTQKEEIQRSQRQHIDFSKEADTKIKLLHKNEKKLQVLIEKNRKDEEKENEDLENLEKQNMRLQEQLEALPEKVEQLQRETKREEQNLETKKAELQRSEHNKKLRLKEYSSGIAYYQQFLGLTYERVGEQGLRLVFTKVDSKNPSKEFYFSLSLNESNSYEMGECQPEVQCIDILEQLNSSNNLSVFVVGMRKLFQEYARKSVPQ
eukprot:TRINITY_DN4450_c0_g1_i1.p1 TRINITY_DN4450_c0_g1~~TRINITY_DN4450_c0_g1_i1.p1  ORF type:complete len:231 (-),score=52.04 TRINITY_DN4450_c0_g1_i1:100-792(-)